MIHIDDSLTPTDLSPQLERMWAASAVKIRAIEQEFRNQQGAPVLTVAGRYRPQGWTEWTQGFQFGSALLQFEATGDAEFYELGRRQTLSRMAGHVTHIGVHDHGFNNVSTYGSLRRLMLTGRVERDDYALGMCELALRASGAVQAARWTPTADGEGFIHSFNGPHSLFSDTIRSLRSLALAWRLGQELHGENDERISLLRRLVEHAVVTARYNVYYGRDHDAYDVRGRVVHESVFNTTDGRYRCPSTQQGYSPFTTWTRGLAWIMCGYAEQLEFLATLGDDDLDGIFDRRELERVLQEAAQASCDFYLQNTPIDGVPYWDTGAPGLTQMGDYLARPSDPFNDFEPVDSSAAAIAAQGLLRLGRYLESRTAGNEQTNEHSEAGSQYRQAGLTVARSLLQDPYLSEAADHQGLLLHSIYHRPRNWDHIPAGSSIPCGEACQWGDYHLRELGVLIQDMAEDSWFTFFDGLDCEA